MKNIAAAACLALVTALPAAALAQPRAADITDMPALRTAVQADKKGLVADTLQLTDAEAKRFWPIYDEYQRHLDTTHRRRARAIEQVVAKDEPVTDRFARQIANEMLAIDEAEYRDWRTVARTTLRALPAKKAARYLQLEAKIRILDNYEIAAAQRLIR